MTLESWQRQLSMGPLPRAEALPGVTWASGGEVAVAHAVADCPLQNSVDGGATRRVAPAVPTPRCVWH